MTATMRMLTYGVAADSVDDYVRIGESTTIESLKYFVKAVVAMFSERYLRSPNNDDISRLLAMGSNHGFPGMLGSIDCVHWNTERSHNDINVLDRSSVFSLLTQGRASPVSYSINRNDYTMGYYLADELAMKDVERAFGVLQARFVIVQGLARFWKTEIMEDMMMTCIIMHNMIVEDERDANGIDFNYDTISESLPLVSHERTPKLFEFIQNHRRIRDRGTHSKLKQDLVEHLWTLHGDSL
ncbi:uncharacterized protein LOC114283734 [Camellia sinensis]|uniref:uncharacterized protein LOC114283734 n=1 Tax=Camellia sinensis TaxID=4442 RepID=UPI00103647D9|nr:uncharacterized protein LOC114283734 [Camellia sinensis]